MKAHHKKKPFIISRQPSKKGASSNEDQQLKRALVPISQSDSNIELQNQILAQKTVYKNCYHLFKVNAGILPELLQRYADDNYKYRDEEFTQQANNFLMKISSSKKIPKDLRAKYPLYFILVSICKIFMLNEYEIVVLACALDHCNWKVEETVYLEEAKFLKEFPGELGGEIDTDCKRLIIYLLIVTFSLKQYLNDKGEVDKIHAYCESICTNFQAIFNRWTRIYSHKFNYSPVEINKKFRNLSTQEPEDTQNGLKDYNIVVDSIMNLTGSYKSKVNPKLAGNQRMPQIFMPQSSPFASIPLTPLNAPLETNLLFPDLSFNLPQMTFERTLSRPKTTVDFDTLELPPELEKISRRTSSSHMPEDSARKKFKPNNGTSGYFSREESIMKDFSNFFTNNLTKGVAEIEDFFFNNPLPGLSKMSSTTSQAMVEEPNLFRFHSNISSWNKE